MTKFFYTRFTICYIISCIFIPNVWAESADAKTPSLKRNAPYNRALEEFNRTQSINKSMQSDPAIRAIKEHERILKLNNEANIVHYTSVLAKNPKDSKAYAKRGKAYSAMKNYDKAQQDFSKALELDPKLGDAYVGRAVTYLMKKDYDNCWKDVHKAESLGEKFWPAFTDSLKKESKREK